MSNETYITKYRPINLDEIIGHKNIVLSLRELFKDKLNLPHGYIFSGNSGTGKSTFSRIIAREIGCNDYNITEVDAGVYSGVDSIRELLNSLQYSGLGSNPIKFIIIDECQKLSSSSFDALLKTLEEPPPHVYFCFCTTDDNKIPKTIKNRCHIYNLKPIDTKEIYTLLILVKDNENLKLPYDCLELIAEKCEGVPRQALSYLSQCRGCTNKKEVAELIESVVENNEVVELCRAIMNKSHWSSIALIIKNLKEQKLQPESVRINIVNWFNACALNSNDAKNAVKFLTILNNFIKPIYENTGWATLTVACGGAIFHE